MATNAKRNEKDGLPPPDKDGIVRYSSALIPDGHKDWKGGAVEVRVLKSYEERVDNLGNKTRHPISWCVAPHKVRLVKKDEIITLTDKRVIDLVVRENLGEIVTDDGVAVKKQKKTAAENKSL